MNSKYFFAVLATLLILWGGVAITRHTWSSWLAGDIQTMNTLRYWSRDGIGTHYGLFMTQGYTPFVKIFESQELNQHAMSSVRKTPSGLVQSIYYNHFPGGYLLPLYFLSGIVGVSTEIPFQIFQYTLSLLSLFFLYLFLKEVFNKQWTAQLGTVLYASSWLFLNFSFTLANQPIDDLLRFVLLWLIVQNPEKQKIPYKNFLIFFLYAILCISSLDSILFILAFTVLYHILITKKWHWKEWFILGAIAFVARVAQLAQSAAAWGIQGALQDIGYSFSQRATETGPVSFYLLAKQRVYGTTLEWLKTISYSNHSNLLRFSLAIAVLVYCALLIKIYWKSDAEKKRVLTIVGILAVAGSTFVLLVPVPGYMQYEGRQWLPCLLMATLAGFSWFLEEKQEKKRTVEQCLIGAFSIAYMIFVLSTGLQTVRTSHPLYAFPEGGPSSPEKLLAEKIGAYSTAKNELVIFYDPAQKIRQNLPVEKEGFVYQLSSYLAYYSDRFLLGDTTKEATLRDMEAINAATKGKVQFIILAENPEDTKEILGLWSNTCGQTKETPSVASLDGWSAVRTSSCEAL